MRVMEKTKLNGKRTIRLEALGPLYFHYTDLSTTMC